MHVIACVAFIELHAYICNEHKTLHRCIYGYKKKVHVSGIYAVNFGHMHTTLGWLAILYYLSNVRRVSVQGSLYALSGFVIRYFELSV